jgi:hypothetical protein
MFAELVMLTSASPVTVLECPASAARFLHGSRRKENHRGSDVLRVAYFPDRTS